MKNIAKIIRRFIVLLLISSILILILNLAVLAFFSLQQDSNKSPYTLAQQTADAFILTPEGGYLSDSMIKTLAQENAWAIFIDNTTHQVRWKTANTPDTIPTAYNFSAIADLTRGYIDGYPTYPGTSENGLMVVGFPKDRYWKHMSPSWDYTLIANAPVIAISLLGINILLIFVIYFITNTKMLRSIQPIIRGIESLPTASPEQIPAVGLFSDLSDKINQTAALLTDQRRHLQKKESARANWITGVSHDIRTPLSMIMGYAGQLAEDPHLQKDDAQKAAIIVRQSERIKNLINNLNLASKLEYHMQPLNPKIENAVAILRQTAVDFMNIDINDAYPIIWQTDTHLTNCPVCVDKNLIQRALSNLIQNAITHNPDGCQIYVCAEIFADNCILSVDDDGIGISDQQLEILNHTPHYMLCDSSTASPRHGLGLLIVHQVAEVHGGHILIKHSPYGGLQVQLVLPLKKMQ